MSTTSNTAYELTRLSGPADDGSHEYAVIDVHKTSGPQPATLVEYDTPSDPLPHPPTFTPSFKPEPTPEATPTPGDGDVPKKVEGGAYLNITIEK